MKKCYSLLITVVMLLTTLSLAVLPISASDTTSGWCGADATWSFDERTETLTISGEGEMSDYEADRYSSGLITHPWARLRNKIKKIVIEDGITKIGKYAFALCDQVLEVTIPPSVKVVNSNAFGDVNRLESIYITDLAAWCQIDFNNEEASPTHAGGILYINGKMLPTDLTIPEGVTTIGSHAFRNTTLMAVTLPEGVETIEWGAFADCSLLAWVSLPSSLNKIGMDVFGNCPYLYTVQYYGDEEAWNAVEKHLFWDENMNPTCSIEFKEIVQTTATTVTTAVPTTVPTSEQTVASDVETTLSQTQTVAPVTTAASTQKQDTAKKGCSSTVLGGVAMIALISCAAAWMIKKKEN